MASLYEMTAEFESLFNQYEDIVNHEFTPDGNGGFINDDGEAVDPAAVRQEWAAAWFNTLDAMETEITEKAEAVAVYIKNLTAEADSIKDEENRLKARRQTKENSVKRMKQYLMDCMTAAKLKKVDMPRAVISIRNNAESVVITDETNFISWAETKGFDDLLKYLEPEIRKSAVKPMLQNGEDVPFAELVRTQSVIIK